jgi:ADP-ribosylglycohydrolase
VLGVVQAPTAPDDRGDLFAWAEGRSLTRNGVEVRPPSNSAGLDWRTVVAMNERAADYAAANTRRLAPARFLAIPSIAYCLALAAVGDVDAAVSLGSGLAPYDVAGGHALLIGAGRSLADLKGAPIVYGEGVGYAGCIGASPPLIDALAQRNLKGAVGKYYLKRHDVPPPSRCPIPEGLSRAQGALLGQLAGDALGSAVEFLGADEIRRRHPSGVHNLAPGGRWNLIAGQPTDDGEMALALARSLVSRGGFDRDAVGQAYLAWRQSGPFDIGGTTSKGVAAIAAGRAAVSDSQANGALMRASPIGIFAAGDPAEAAEFGERDAALTHPSPVCRAASRAYCAAIAVGVAGADPEAMWSAAHAHAGEGAGACTVRAALEAARSGGPASFEQNQGWALTALQNAFRRLLDGASLEEAVIATVAKGGDTDTNAAICGALIGACQGRTATPVRWRRLILSCRPLPGPDVAHPRPILFWPDDTLDPAEALQAADRGAVR